MRRDSQAVAEAGAADRPGVLLVAFHFPPDASSTGRLRTLGFARHLPDFGWRPVVLAPSARAYAQTDIHGLEDVPAGLPVYRTPAIDASRHLAWRGKYMGVLALPDRWSSWWLTAVARGLALIRQHRIKMIWSTYPIGTAHLIALMLARLTGLPWIADFRDPVVPDGTMLQRRAMAAMEQRSLSRAAAAVFTTPGARALYAQRYPQLATDDRLHVIPNGFEETTLARAAAPAAPDADQPVYLVHSGLLYPQGRNPEPFFRALVALKADGRVDHTRLQVTLRASDWEADYQARIDALDVADIVSLAPPVAYQEALAEQGAAHGLLLFQGSEFNAQIPAKVFEYLRIGRPVFALIDEQGDTAALLAELGGSERAAIDDAEDIAARLSLFMDRIRAAQAPTINDDALARYTRRACTERLAGLLDSVREHST